MSARSTQSFPHHPLVSLRLRQRLSGLAKEVVHGVAIRPFEGGWPVGLIGIELLQTVLDARVAASEHLQQFPTPCCQLKSSLATRDLATSDRCFGVLRQGCPASLNLCLDLG